MAIEDEIELRAEAISQLDRLGVSSRMTQSSQISGPRQGMVYHHLKHMVSFDDPEACRLFMGSENKFASASSSIVKLDNHDYEVYSIIEKDKYNAMYVLKRVGKEYYRVFERVEVDEVSESFGIGINNKVLDRSKVGDVIPAGTIIQKSSNFDKHMNYRYVKNLNVVYLVSTMCYEDGITIMNGAENMLSVIKAKKQRIKIADNDIFLNLKGDDDDYLTLPDVGESIDDGMLTAIRKKTNDKILSSMTKRKMQRIEASDRKIYADGKVIRYDFYHNKDTSKLIDAKASSKLNKLIRADRDYHKKICKILGHIIANYEYCDKLAFLFNRSRAFLDPKDLIQDDVDSVNNIIMDVSFLDSDPCTPGTKLVGRYGNKGVVCKIIPPELSWFTESGEPIHLVFSAMGVPARLNIGQCKETFSLMTCSRVERALFYNQLKAQVDEEYHKADTFINTITTINMPLDDKFDLLCTFISNYNKDQAKALKKMWKKYTSKERSIFMHNVMKDGIHLCFDPINAPNLETLEAVRDWCTEQGINVEPERIVFPDGSKTLKRVLVGKQAIIRLKQDPVDKYSVRGSGVINALSSTPYKSNAKKEGIEPHTDTAVRIGEFESAYLRAANQPEADACFFDMYSNSPAGRDKFAEAYEDDDTRYASLADVVFDGRKKNREALDGLMHCKAVRLKIKKELYKKPQSVIDLPARKAHYEKIRAERDKKIDDDWEKDLRSSIVFK